MHDLIWPTNQKQTRVMYMETDTVSTHKSGLQVPAPAVVQEAHSDSSHKVTNQDGQISHLNVWHNQLHKFL